VTGFKPTFGRFSIKGILPFAQSLDTLGFFTHTAADMSALWQALDLDEAGADANVFGAPSPLPLVDPLMATAFHEALVALQQAGVSIRFINIAGMLATLADAAHVVMCYEGARVHQQRYQEYGERLADLAELVETGLQIPASRYDAARRHIDACKQKVAELYGSTPVILVPAATGPAPLGLGSTGDPTMNAPWTALGTPAISIPLPVGQSLPLGLQLTAAPAHDGMLLRSAERVAEILRSV
jgi:Asp-tRNA(Asn)/Glu-tRNA(Gln) amidotransferase A subunit family amidase